MNPHERPEHDQAETLGRAEAFHLDLEVVHMEQEAVPAARFGVPTVGCWL
jgi:hypothetical protein